ncbi:MULTISPECIES: hypothetical protein [Anoxybacillus]|uniref:Sterol-binding protein n=1 Tax=Anoxybacillus ayderensis TaxID=265546 RepID=A0A0D0HLX7_9BACL|nr:MULTISPECIES: hypothetical protein [Anoxybacillus]EPZ39845.1 hypothetical protein C289_0068 [Anoxybacillus ayderensis]KIP21169.1 hypothetical protein JV16_01663 [Anoxybacillus ayderensis]MED0686328.1 sterol-binding protein [Anoxybacillus ayderensis]NNU96225.1 sterol-binding protein [Anoxybacillus sp. EFIL]
MNMLTPILPNDGLYIQLQWESGQILLSISKEGIQRVEKANEDRVISIRGSAQAIMSLLQGSLKLQQQLRLNELSVTASFRHILLLESVFFLAKPYDLVH